jgi:hypothetical protein
VNGCGFFYLRATAGPVRVSAMIGRSIQNFLALEAALAGDPALGGIYWPPCI